MRGETTNFCDSVTTLNNVKTIDLKSHSKLSKRLKYIELQAFSKPKQIRVSPEFCVQ